MSDNSVKKIQPFTIGTRLSLPPSSRCAELGDVFSQPVDECKLRSRLSGQVCMYLGEGHQGDWQEDAAAEDHLHSGAVAQSNTSRSIRKITLSASLEAGEDRTSPHTVPVVDQQKKRQPTASGGDEVVPVLQSHSWTGEEQGQEDCHVGLCLHDWQEVCETLQREIRHCEKTLVRMEQEEEEQLLAKMFEENVDKMQLTRRILHLKQDAQQHNNPKTHTNTHYTTLVEVKNISNRKRNKMLMEMESHLKDYHMNLQLALQVSSFYQLADSVISAIGHLRSNLSATHTQEVSSGIDMRDVADKITMLDESVSQLSALHPTLAARITHKQDEVKEKWTLLNTMLRKEKTILINDTEDPTPTSSGPLESSTRMMGNEDKEEQNHLQGCTEDQGLVENTRLDEFLLKLNMLCEELVRRQETDFPAENDLELLDVQKTEEVKNLSIVEGWLQMLQASINQESINDSEHVLPLWDVQAREEKVDVLHSQQTQDQMAKAEIYQDLLRWQCCAQLGADAMDEKGSYASESCHGNKALHVDMSADVTLMDIAGDRAQDICNAAGRVTFLPDQGRVGQCLCQCAMLSMDILDAERDLAVRYEPDHTRLEILQEQQDELEVEYKSMEEEMKDVEKLRDVLDVSDGLQMWEELSVSMQENRIHLTQLEQLQRFFANYLAMISWTESTKKSLFSGSSAVSEMDIKQKLQQFEDLAAAGQKLVDEGHRLKEMIRERSEELQSMLEWLLLQWRGHHQRPDKTKPKQIFSLDSQSSSVEDVIESEELQEKLKLRSHNSKTIACRDHVAKAPFLMLKENPTTSLGGTINLILSLGQVQEPEEGPKHRVSTFLHVKDNESVTSETERGTPPHLINQTTSSSSCTCLSPHHLLSHSCLRKRKGMRRKENRRRTITVGELEEKQKFSHTHHKPSTHTWPLREKMKSQALDVEFTGAHHLHTSLIKPNIISEDVGNLTYPSDQDRGCSGSPDRTSIKQNSFKHLTLGSVLSFNLPKDLNLIQSIPHLISVDPQGPNGNCMDLHGTDRQKAKKSTEKWITSSVVPCGDTATGDINSTKEFPSIFTLSNQEGSSKEMLNRMSADLTHFNDLQDEVLQELEHPGNDMENPAMVLSSSLQLQDNQDVAFLKNIDFCRNFCSGRGVASVIVNHVCPSVHTKIRDLKGHIYHPPAHWQIHKEHSRSCMRTTPPTVMDLRRESAPVSSNTGKSSICLPSKELVKVSTMMNKDSSSSLDALQPDHGQFEEEEAELEDIWNRCGDVPQPIPDEPGNKWSTQCGQLTFEHADNLCEKVFTVCTSNLPLAELQLGFSEEPSHSLSAEQPPAHTPSHAAKPSISQGLYHELVTEQKEFQSMEGKLEIKHQLDKGRKAPCRTWRIFHAVLVKQTLCLYLEEKRTGMDESLSLDITNAECVTEYKRKPNSFSLRLYDGSDYMLSAANPFLMTKWMLKLQTNAIAGLRKMKPGDHLSSSTVSPLSDCIIRRDTHDVGHIAEMSCSSHPPDIKPPPTATHQSQTKPSNQRQKHCFTSAVYQKIKPVCAPHVTVTMLLNDQLQESVTDSNTSH